MTLNIFIVSVFVGVAMAITWECHTDADCAHDQCCSKVPWMQVVGRRQLVLQPPDVFPEPYQSVTCQPYVKENASCYNMYRQNGDCMCAPGQVCRYFPELDTYNRPPVLLVPTVPTLSPGRRAIYADPNSYLCVRA